MANGDRQGWPTEFLDGCEQEVCDRFGQIAAMTFAAGAVQGGHVGTSAGADRDSSLAALGAPDIGREPDLQADDEDFGHAATLFLTRHRQLATVKVIRSAMMRTRVSVLSTAKAGDSAAFSALARAVTASGSTSLRDLILGMVFLNRCCRVCCAGS